MGSVGGKLSSSSEDASDPGEFENHVPVVEVVEGVEVVEVVKGAKGVNFVNIDVFFCEEAVS